MSKKVVVMLVAVVLVLAMVSCNTYKRCPAYTEVQTETVEDAKV